ncbi:hypothetical protein Cci01nite_23030 [Catellatospora citrea]|uniref:Lipoprotein n=1 Tax=Catellatospora citrea TaxID=53366 RepID=A0A8J3KKZ9_9ACTN|nr:hypothetical protein Cci01nite_23030 [Catellatospora citrea]
MRGLATTGGRWAVTAVLLAATGLTGCGGAPSPSPSGGVVASNEAPSATAAAGCPLPPRSAQAQTADPLRATVNVRRITDGRGFNYAFSEQTLAKHPAALETGSAQDRTPWSAEDAWKDGLFLLGAARVLVTFQNPGAEPIAVKNVRLVNIVEECMPLALAYHMGTEGSGFATVSLSFNIDADVPIAYGYDFLAQPGAAVQPHGKSFFDEKTVQLKPGEEQDFSIYVASLRRPYSFDIALDLTVGGKTEVQLLRNGDVPWRFAPNLCPTTAQQAALAPADLAWMRERVFQKALRRTSGPNGDVTVMSEEDPKKVSGPCNAL